MTVYIRGNGHNSRIELATIHEGKGSFQEDTSTKHAQVQLLQSALTQIGYDTKGVDGIFGNNTLKAVKAFQQANDLKVDGCWGINSLNMLEKHLGRHLDAINCFIPIQALICNDVLNKTHKKSKYKEMMAERVLSFDYTAKVIIEQNKTYRCLSTTEYLHNLNKLASEKSNTYDILDCSGYLLKARNGLGYHGATTNFCKHCSVFGSISDLGGYENLVPGMELYQACRYSEDSALFYASHIGVYAGIVRFADGRYHHAVYQSSANFGKRYTMYQKEYGKNGCQNGPNLSTLSSAWTYWGWSKHVTI